MIGLFISNGCVTCKSVVRDLPEPWASQVLVLQVEFDEEAKHYRVYNKGEPTGGVAPIDTVPTMWFSDTGEAYQGYTKIMNRLTDVSR